MIKNLADYFLPQQEYYLEEISYNRIDKQGSASEYSLNCIDKIDVEINDDFVTILVKRTLQFEPNEIFELTISFGSILKFHPDMKNDYDWEKIDLAEEFKQNGQFVLGNLMNRISLLIAEITASFGQPPFILPPRIAPNNMS